MQSLNLRPAMPADVPQILQFIRDLATYEREPDAVHATEADLLRDGFGETKRFDCIIADLHESGTPIPAGFALYFHNYSTWRGHAGIYLEDLYVSPEHRGKGIGKALLIRVAAIAVAEGCRPISRQNLDPLEQIEVVLRPLAEVPAMIASGELCHAQVIAAFALAGLL